MSSITENPAKLSEPAGANKPTVPNLLRLREPEIARQLTAFRDRLNDLLLDQLAETFLHDPTSRVKEGSQPLSELKAVAVALHMLTRDSWKAEDFKVFDSCWRELTLSDLFDDFEPDRFRIQQCVEEARKYCLSNVPFDNSAAVFYPGSSTTQREARLPKKKPADNTPEPLVNHPLVRHAIKVLNATPVEPNSDEAVDSPFAQPEAKAEQVTDKEAGNSGQENTQPTTDNREELLRQYGAHADGDVNRHRRK
jgi:hypothetical protein